MEVSTPTGGAIESSAVAESYGVVSDQPVRAKPEELYYEPVELETDDGTPVSALRILSAGAR